PPSDRLVPDPSQLRRSLRARLSRARRRVAALGPIDFPAMARPLAIFCDFDGTITEKDMVVSICEAFCPPAWKDVVRDILDRRKTVKDGVAEMFAMIPSSKKAEIVEFAERTMRPR